MHGSPQDSLHAGMMPIDTTATTPGGVPTMPRAPRKCPTPGCENRIPGGGRNRYCETHTTHHWGGGGSQRGWQHEKWAKAIKARDRTCQLRYPGCTGNADEADHIHNIKSGGQRYSLTNGQGACTHCHGIKTRREAQAARNNKHTT